MNDDSKWELRQRQRFWAGRYDGESRLAGGEVAGALARLIEPVRREWAASGRIPPWCGVDFLRGWAYYLVMQEKTHHDYRLAVGGESESEFCAVLAAIDVHPHALMADRPPLTLESSAPPPTSTRLNSLLGDNDPWNRHLINAWRVCAEPFLEAVPPRPTASIAEGHDGHGFFDRIAFLTPLLHVLMFGLGWSRMDLGLTRWIELGRPTDEPVLNAVQRWWGDDVEGFVAWLALNPQIVELFRRGLVGEDAPALDIIDDRYAALRREPRWRAVWGGPGDSMHLKVHFEAPLAPAVPDTFLGEAQSDERGVPRVAMTTPGYSGWYTALRRYSGPTRIGGRDVRVDVTCTPIGWLGQYRRSTETGLWFRGAHSVHMLGN